MPNQRQLPLEGRLEQTKRPNGILHTLRQTGSYVQQKRTRNSDKKGQDMEFNYFRFSWAKIKIF